MSRYDDDGYLDDWHSWPRYLREDERRARAGRAAKKLTRGGRELHPVVVEGRIAAKSAWGKGWCTTLASYGDYSNRLPRGMSYLRSGAVIDLQIERGRVAALVSGSSVYKVGIHIRPLTKPRWRAIKEKCAGRITSLVALLRGELSPPIMTMMARRDEGLFPAPAEIDVTCSCPDSAIMCKHVAAVLFGIGTRLDEEPELLFVLRGVDHRELITDAPVTAVKRGRRASKSADKMASADLEAVFGIELAEQSEAGSASGEARSSRKSTKRKTESGRPGSARGGGKAKSKGKTGAVKRVKKSGMAKRASASRSGATAKKAATTRSVRKGRSDKR
jgi:uncharacterized Zn finger protein